MNTNLQRACALALIAACATPATAQRSDRDDMRDRVALKNGREIRGRVQNRWGDEILVMQGGKRVRADRDKVDEIDTVRDRLRAFFARRAGRDHDDAATHWELSEWCEQRDLWHLARVEAYATVARDPDHAAAHEFLGHRKAREGWRWPVGSRWFTREKFDEYTSEIGHPFVLRSEHVSIETDAGVRRAVDAALDLERMYLWWLDTHGEAMGLDEVLEPLDFVIYADESAFPGMNSARYPYYVPHPYGARSFVFFEAGAGTPTELFTTATQHLLYRTLARDSDPGGQRERFCAWVEIGLGRYAQSLFSGDPGQAEPGTPAPGGEVAELVLEGKRYSLKNTLHLNVRDHFYTAGSVRRRTGEIRAETHWAAVQMFVTFLLDAEANPGLEPKFFAYVREAIGEARGDSSSLFDKTIGARIESFERPWHAWLEQRANPGQPR